MPRKPSIVRTKLPPAPEPVQPTTVSTKSGPGVVKVLQGKRAASPPLLVLTPSDASAEARKKAKTVSKSLRLVIPRAVPSAPAQFKYCIVQHTANKHLTYLGVEGITGSRDGMTERKIFFAYFPPDMFVYQKSVSDGVFDPMPCVQIKPAPPVEVTTAKWWQNIDSREFDLHFKGVKCFPSPTTGFKTGDYVSFKHRPGSYGFVSYVVYRTSSEPLYLVCAVIDGNCRLVMSTRMEVGGPEFTFVPPTAPFWSKSEFPLYHAENPGSLSFFEPPIAGFGIGDPVTVFPAGSKLPLDGKIAFVTKLREDIIASYHVELAGGQIVCYTERDVLGPRVDRFSADLDPAHLTPDPDLMQALAEEDEWDYGILGCDEEMPEKPPSPSGTHVDPADAMLFVTPPWELTGPTVVRRKTGIEEIPRPGVLINEAARRIRERDEAR